MSFLKWADRVIAGLLILLTALLLGLLLGLVVTALWLFGGDTRFKP